MVVVQAIASGSDGGGAALKPRGVLGGVVWTLAANYAVRLTNLLITILLARSVGPHGMGVVAAALLCVEIIDTIRDFGLREALIYRPRMDASYAGTAFLVIIAVSLVQALALVGFAQAGPLFFEDRAITPVLTCLALLFPVSGLGSAHEAMLQREGKFGRRAIAELLGVLVKAGVAIGLLWSGTGIWSIILGILAGAIVRTVALWLLSDWHPVVARPSYVAARELAIYGRHIVAVNIMFLSRMKADQMAIAVLMGEAALGAYFVAARIPEIVIFGVNVAITTVVFPIFSRISHDSDALVRAYEFTLRSSMMLMAPVAIGIAAISGQIVPLLFGEQWHDSASILAILALGGIPLTLGWTSGNVFKAIGKPHLLSIIHVLEVVALTPIIWVTAILSGNLLHVAAAMVASEALSCVVRLVFMSRCGGVGIVQSLRVTLLPIAAAMLMGGAVLAAERLFGTANAWLLLLETVLFGILVYVVILLLVDRRSVRDILALLRSRTGDAASQPAAIQGASK